MRQIAHIYCKLLQETGLSLGQNILLPDISDRALFEGQNHMFFFTYPNILQTQFQFDHFTMISFDKSNAKNDPVR